MTDQDEDAVPVERDPAEWSDEDFFRAVALAVFTAEADDDEAHEHAPNYDW